MSTQFSMLGTMNAALLAQGQEEIVSENDGSLEWRVLARNWPSIVEAELEDSNYFFTKRQQFIITRKDGEYGFDDAFLVPSDALHVRKVWYKHLDQNIDIDWIQSGSYVHVNMPEGVWIEYVYVADQQFWTATFNRGIQLRLEAIILRSIKEEYGEAESFDEKAGVMLQRARTNSSKSRSTKGAYKKGPIGQARNRRG